MKKTYFFLLAVTAMTILAANSAIAFHGGGVAHCDGCHSMHNSPENPISGAPGEALLKGTDASSTCLNCHNGTGTYHVNSADASNINTGGDFAWLTNEYSLDILGIISFHAGDDAGHNVIAVDYGLTQDGISPEAPGGTYDAGLLGCTSCHDAHGQVLDGTAGGQLPIGASGSYADPAPAGTIKGNYRLLGDSMYEAGHNINDGYAFTYDAPIALANGSEGAYVRYGSGMSEWCANCHADFFNNDPDAGLGKHPTSVLLSKDGYDANYNSYVATGDFTGSIATSWDPLVPFETGAVDQATLVSAGVTSTMGPSTGNEQVMCLSCHRAHASAFNNMGRWDFEAEFLASSAVLDPAAANVPATAVPYYGDGLEIDVPTRYNVSQRSLCNKCHVQD
ncbi:MAG: hypothetical protein SCH71_02215 [Desulfobulbaceae bacterium]|nr:hypothetical protein [Desulfobulbaceae bacterium]